MTRLLEIDSTVSVGELNGRERIENIKDVPEIDPDLRELVMRCLATLPENRPRLAVLLDYVGTYCAIKTADSCLDISTAAHETNWHISQLVNAYVLNAET